MKRWLYLLRREQNLVFWEILTSAGYLVCRSLRGFATDDEALSDLRLFHPVDHF